MRLLLVTHFWDHVTQRFHHWHRCATASGHEVDVLTVPATIASGRCAQSATIYRLRRSYIESLLYRLKCKNASRSLSDARLIAKLRELTQRTRYDAVIYCSRPLPIDLNHRNNCALVYDCMDNWAGFDYDRISIVMKEERLARNSDLCVAVTPFLADRLREHGARMCHLVPNGCEVSRFVPVAKQRMARGRATVAPVFGYCGSIHSWFNWDVVIAVSRALPRSIFRICGPIGSHIPALPPNVVIEPAIAYSEVPHFLAGCDVGIIPFKNPTTEDLLGGISPIKLYEYLAAGMPVLASAMPDVLTLATAAPVFACRTATDWVESAAKCIAMLGVRSTEACMAEGVKADWGARWNRIEQAVLGIHA